jgi:hypothetical protein
VQADGDVLLDAVVEGGGLPVVEEEDHGDGLAEVVELQAGCADGGQDAGVGDRARGDGEFAGAEDEVGVCCCSAVVLDVGRREAMERGAPERISYDKECDIDFVGVFEDVVAGRLDHLAVGYDDFAPIESFLLPW